MMALHSRIRVILLELALAALAGCGGSGPGAAPASGEPHVIKFPHVVAPATPKGIMAQRFKELAEERFPGRVRVEVYPSAQLMEDTESIEALAFGEVQMIATSVSLYDRLTQKFQVFDLPFLFPSLAAVERFQASPAGRELLTTLTGNGILGLQFWHNGMKQFSGPRPLIVPSDARGLKFRVMESDILQAEIAAIGGSPQKMAFGEVYQALQTGTVDAQENTWSNIYASKFYEVQPYITETDHGYIGYLVAVNPEFWRGLPADVRPVLDAALIESTEYVNTTARMINDEARDHVVAAGRNTLIELTPEEREQWREAMRPVWNRFAGDIGAELLAAAGAEGSLSQ
jgi:C4-dicarboxylate-binding protein DctP